MGLVIKRTVLLSLLIASPLLYAEWQGPEVVVESPWGGGGNEFGIIIGDVPAYDILPGPYDVSEAGNIVMADKVNGRFKVFNSKHELLSLVTPPVDRPSRWTIVPAFAGENISLILDKYYFYNIEGELLAERVSPRYAQLDRYVNGSLYVYLKSPKNQSVKYDQWNEYTNLGELVKTHDHKPLLLGRVYDDVFMYGGKKTYRTIITFDDALLAITDKRENLCEHFDRDRDGNVYCVRDKKVTRYNGCGKVVSVLALPDDDITIVPVGVPGVEDNWIINSAYMNPMIDSQGNVFATRRTPEYYSLVKWTWQDSENDLNIGPDAPINISLKALSIDAVELKWERSLQDPGCVTGYQVLRSDTPDGEVTVVANPVKGSEVAIDASVEAGKTYYYSVKALSGINDSEPSSTVSITLDSQ